MHLAFPAKSSNYFISTAPSNPLLNLPFNFDISEVFDPNSLKSNPFSFDDYYASVVAWFFQAKLSNCYIAKASPLLKSFKANSGLIYELIC